MQIANDTLFQASPRDAEEPSCSLAWSSREKSAVGQFSLASLLLFTTLFAIIMSAITWSPGAGTALIILLVPAFIRTIRIRVRQKAKGLESISLGERIVIFGQSLGVVALIAGASAGTLLAIGYPVFSAFAANDPNVVMAFAGGIIAIVPSGLVGLLLIRRLWLPKE